MRNEDDGLHAGGTGVRGHGCRGVAGGDAGNALHSQAHCLRGAAGHSVVFERTGGIESLVFKYDLVDAGVARSLRRIQ